MIHDMLNAIQLMTLGSQFNIFKIFWNWNEIEEQWQALVKLIESPRSKIPSEFFQLFNV